MRETLLQPLNPDCSSSQGEPGKPGERGAPGPVGAVVSISPGPICSAHCNPSPCTLHEVSEPPAISPLGPRNTPLRCFLFLSIGSCWQRWRSWSSGCPWPCCECLGNGNWGGGRRSRKGSFSGPFSCSPSPGPSLPARVLLVSEENKAPLAPPDFRCCLKPMGWFRGGWGDPPFGV